MTEYKITDGKYVIIDMARTLPEALDSAARRLECDRSQLILLSKKERPPVGAGERRKMLHKGSIHNENICSIPRNSIFGNRGGVQNV